MWNLARQGLWNSRGRTLTGVLGIAAMVSLAYVLTGVTEGFSRETERTLEALGETYWIPSESTGLLTGLRPMSHAPENSQPVLYARDIVATDDSDLNVFGMMNLTAQLSVGRGFATTGEVVIDRSAGIDLGDRIELAGSEFKVVGITNGIRMYAGSPVAFILIKDMQDLYFEGAPVARFFVGGDPSADIASLRKMTLQEADRDLSRSVKDAVSSIALTRTLLWLMVAGIIFVLQRIALLEQWPELATLRCLGANTRYIAGALAFNGLIVGLLGGGLGILVGIPMGRLFPLSVESSLSTALRLLALAALAAATVASVGAARVRRITPMEAFRS